jgi:hypothetical protein
MSFSNPSSTPGTPLDEGSDTAESSVFSKLPVTGTADEPPTNLSLSPDKQHVLYSQEDPEMAEIFLTWWNETPYAIALRKRGDSSHGASPTWGRTVKGKSSINLLQYYHEAANIFQGEPKILCQSCWTGQIHPTTFRTGTTGLMRHLKSQRCQKKGNRSFSLVLDTQVDFFLSSGFIT